jgi:hypothetical protein
MGNVPIHDIDGYCLEGDDVSVCVQVFTTVDGNGDAPPGSGSAAPGDNRQDTRTMFVVLLQAPM